MVGLGGQFIHCAFGCAGTGRRGLFRLADARRCHLVSWAPAVALDRARGREPHCEVMKKKGDAGVLAAGRVLR
ncbi:hypothetical protein GCM10009544_02720 [Streptomyces stramineus]|uniref:Uncharacterized protein n=1 Tax=Streptomyces stramineus TaxID=173861 RepID=A0ABP3J907_9ACTN